MTAPAGAPRHGPAQLSTVAEHRRACLDLVQPLAPLEVSLLDAMGCVLAEDVVAARALPAFDNSGMDGYAVRLHDVAGAAPGSPVRLPVVADLAAGSAESLRLAPGTAVRIMTGAPVPPNTGAVVPVEWTDGGVAAVEIRHEPRDGQHVRRAGEDVGAGAVVVEAGTRLEPRHVAVLAAVGRARVRVRPRPRVVVISTGSEVVEPGSRLRHGQLHDANGFGLTAAALDVGAQAYRVGVVRDDPVELQRTLEDQLVRADVIITSGGVSAGAYDVVKEVLDRTGSVTFGGVAMQPGMPQGAGTLGEDATPLFALPGNPVSAFVSFEVFVRPALRRMLGEDESAPDPHRPQVTATAAQGWTSPAGKEQYVRARWWREAGGGLRVEPVSGPGSHLVTALASTTCLAVVPVGVDRVEPGDEVQVVLLGPGA